jgi:hypothetical protein
MVDLYQSIGKRVFLINSYSGVAEKIPGILVEATVFRADEFTPGLHDGGGRGPKGYYWFVTSDMITLRESLVRKTTGFAKFIKRIEQKQLNV